VRVSIGTAGVLGLIRVPMTAAPTTAYLMVGDRCVVNCAYCAQAREAQSDSGALSRVTWPQFRVSRVVPSLRRAEQQGLIRRCCIQVTVGQDSYHEVLRIVRHIRRSVSMSLSVAILPAHMAQVEELIEAGIDSIGFGLDAAVERVFAQVKGPHWRHMLGVIASTAERFPGIGTVHLVVGLGETEREMIERILWAHDLSLGIGLFAFTPVRGTQMADCRQPPLRQYRRIQAARWLILNYGAGMMNFRFGQQGALEGIHLAGWREALRDGAAFQTPGCPDCNRPFYNERPGGAMYNYPRPLTAEEADEALRAAELEGSDD
jgi:biotin synthase-related radical SAM superfamily protein